LPFQRSTILLFFRDQQYCNFRDLKSSGDQPAELVTTPTDAAAAAGEDVMGNTGSGEVTLTSVQLKVVEKKPAQAGTKKGGF